MTPIKTIFQAPMGSPEHWTPSGWFSRLGHRGVLDPIRLIFGGHRIYIFRSKLQIDFNPLKSCPIESIRPPKWSAGPRASFEGHLCLLMKTVGFHQHPEGTKLMAPRKSTWWGPVPPRSISFIFHKKSLIGPDGGRCFSRAHRFMSHGGELPGRGFYFLLITWKKQLVPP